MRTALDGLAARLWTALPCIVQSYDPAGPSISAQPTAQVSVQQSDGSTRLTTLPMLVDVPVIFPGGGGVSLTFPVQAGDECLVVFASRPIDTWWQNGGISAPGARRSHSLADGIAILGLRSRSNAPPAISTTEVQLRSDDGTTRVALDAAAEKISMHAGALSVTLSPTRVDLGGPGGAAVQTVSGPSTKVFAVT